MSGDSITRWTVRAALALYVATVALRLGTQGRPKAARVLWTLGCLLFLAHVAAAFHYFHGWSHGHAYGETARQTRELFGLDWGGGLYFNYLFTVVWVADAAYWWFAGIEAYQRRGRWIDASVHAFFAFMAVNGAVVFATSPTRRAGLTAAAALALFALVRLLRVRQRADRRLG